MHCATRAGCVSRKGGTGGGGWGHLQGDMHMVASLVPRPRLAFRRLQYGNSDEKLGGAWERGYMVAAGLGCESAMVGTVWANSCPGCMDRL